MNIYAAHLLTAMNTRPSRSGTRKDYKVCDAKPEECRFNNKYYTPGMKDEKSWSLPFSDDSCPVRCPYLIENNT